MRSLELYNNLIAAIDSSHQSLWSIYKNDITCAPGCDACCILESVNAIEWYRIINTMAGMAACDRDHIYRAAIPSLVATDTSPCVFDLNGRCSIYPQRPIICRTHGMPLLIEGRVDFCPKNFIRCQTIQSEFILDLEKINAAFSRINRLFINEIDDVRFARDRYMLREIQNFPIDFLK